MPALITAMRDVAHRGGGEPLSVDDMAMIIDSCEQDRDFWQYLSHLRKTERFGMSGDVMVSSPT